MSDEPPSRGRWALAGFALAALVCGALAFWWLASGERQARSYAVAIEHGRAEQAAAQDIEDRMASGARDEGYQWAKARGLTDPADCNELEGAAHAGCLDWVAQAGARPQ
jgi:hypothetical protein